jgi:hypothetical protein
MNEGIDAVGGDPDCAVVREACDRALFVACSEQAEPNDRCAAITIALALTACPDHVSVRTDAGDDVIADYSGISVRFHKVGETCNISWDRRIASRDAPGVAQADWLPDLAADDADHRRNAACLQDLKKYLPLARDSVARAAVLGLAWSQLQRLPVSSEYRFSYTEPSDHTIECREIGVWIVIDEKDEIAGAHYPGMSSEVDDRAPSDNNPSGVWEGTLKYSEDDSSVVRIDSLRFFDDSAIISGELINAEWGHCQFEFRLLKSQNEGHARYVGDNVVAHAAKETIDYPFSLAISLRRDGDDMQFDGMWREYGSDYPVVGFLSPLEL